MGGRRRYRYKLSAYGETEGISARTAYKWIALVLALAVVAIIVLVV